MTALIAARLLFDSVGTDHQLIINGSSTNHQLIIYLIWHYVLWRYLLWHYVLIIN
jgi:hypothetical protein